MTGRIGTRGASVFWMSWLYKGGNWVASARTPCPLYTENEILFFIPILDMLLIRQATRNDAAVLLAMIRELAAFERMPELVKNREEDLARDGFGEKPRFRALIAEGSGQVAGYSIYFDYYSTWAGAGIFLEDLFVRAAF